MNSEDFCGARGSCLAQLRSVAFSCLQLRPVAAGKSVCSLRPSECAPLGKAARVARPSEQNSDGPQSLVCASKTGQLCPFCRFTFLRARSALLLRACSPAALLLLHFSLRATFAPQATVRPHGTVQQPETVCAALLSRRAALLRSRSCKLFEKFALTKRRLSAVCAVYCVLCALWAPNSGPLSATRTNRIALSATQTRQTTLRHTDAQTDTQTHRTHRTRPAGR